MSRRPHPLDALVAPFKADASTAFTLDGVRWSVTLSNEHGHTHTHTVPGFLKCNPETVDWPRFWSMVNGQLEWSKSILTVYPIADLAFDADTLEYIAAVPLREGFQRYLGNYPTIQQAVEGLTLNQFAALQHLCKIRYRAMQNPV